MAATTAAVASTAATAVKATTAATMEAAALMTNVSATAVIELRMMAVAGPMVFPRMVNHEDGIVVVAISPAI